MRISNSRFFVPIKKLWYIMVEGVLILRNSSLKLKTVVDNAILLNYAVSSENISESIKIKTENGFYLKVNVCKFRWNKSRPEKQSHRRHLYIFFLQPLPCFRWYCPLQSILFFFGDSWKEIQSRYFFNCINRYGKSRQWLIASFVGQNESNHLPWRRRVKDDLVIVCRHGNLICTDGDRFFFRENRAGHHNNFPFSYGKRPHQCL